MLHYPDRSELGPAYRDNAVSSLGAAKGLAKHKPEQLPSCKDRIDKPVSHEIKVSVSDNGIGIPEDCLDQIFDRFYRVERKVHTIKGTGLGLTIVKKIVEEVPEKETAPEPEE